MIFFFFFFYPFLFHKKKKKKRTNLFTESSNFDVMILSVNHIEYDMELTKVKKEKMLVFHVFVVIGELGRKGLWRKMPEEAIFIASNV